MQKTTNKEGMAQLTERCLITRREKILEGNGVTTVTYSVLPVLPQESKKKTKNEKGTVGENCH